MLKPKLMYLGKKLGRIFGLEIKRTSSVDFNYKWLEDQDIRTILDIGASVGDFSISIHKILPQAQIYAFEPLKDSYDKLVKNLKHLPKFQAFNCALGDKDNADAEIHHCQYSPSSSLLGLTDLQKEIYPFTDNETVEKIIEKRLDGLAGELDLGENMLIKIDVQGYEDKVISGGREVFSKARIVIAETSFEQFYEGQPLFDEMCTIMKQMGFSFRGSWGPMMKNPVDGRTLYCDSVFIRDTN